MKKPYLLISTCERETTTEQFATLEDAQKRMLSELESYGGVTNPTIGMDENEYAIEEMSAWSNVKEDYKQDWLIVELEDD